MGTLLTGFQCASNISTCVTHGMPQRRRRQSRCTIHRHVKHRKTLNGGLWPKSLIHITMTNSPQPVSGGPGFVVLPLGVKPSAKPGANTSLHILLSQHQPYLTLSILRSHADGLQIRIKGGFACINSMSVSNFNNRANVGNQAVHQTIHGNVIIGQSVQACRITSQW